MSPAASRQLALVNTAISFAAGLLAGYIIRDFYNRLKKSTQNNDLAHQQQPPHRLDRVHHHHNNNCDRGTTNSQTKMNQDEDAGLEDHDQEEESDVAAAGRSAIPKCQSSEDIFFDAPCDSDTALCDDNSIPALSGGGGGGVVSNSTAALQSTTTTTTITIDRQLVYAQVDQQLELVENCGSGDGNNNSSADLVLTVLETLKKHQATLSDDANYWWRCSQATYLLSKANDDNDEETTRNSLMNEAVKHAQRALELDDANGDCHKWYAITSGALGDSAGNFNFVAKVNKGSTFKKHLDIALRLKPNNDPTLFHLRGRFYVEYLKRNYLEQQLARKFIGNIPAGVSHEHALEDFMTAHQLRSAWKENILYMSKALVSLGRHAEAASFIKQGLALPITSNLSSEESYAHAKLNELLAKCKKSW